MQPTRVSTDGGREDNRHGAAGALGLRVDCVELLDLLQVDGDDAFAVIQLDVDL